jgi:hypothetical protein
MDFYYPHLVSIVLTDTTTGAKIEMTAIMTRSQPNIRQWGRGCIEYLAPNTSTFHVYHDNELLEFKSINKAPETA